MKILMLLENEFPPDERVEKDGFYIYKFGDQTSRLNAESQLVFKNKDVPLNYFVMPNTQYEKLIGGVIKPSKLGQEYSPTVLYVKTEEGKATDTHFKALKETQDVMKNRNISATFISKEDSFLVKLNNPIERVHYQRFLTGEGIKSYVHMEKNYQKLSSQISTFLK